MSFARYPAYKDSGVEWLGEVPEHWDVAAGRRVYRQVREQAHAGDVQLSATQKYGVIPQSEFMEAEDQKVMLALKGLDNFKHVEKNDFVISLRSFQGGIEHSAYSGCVSPAYTVLRAQQEIDPSYMAFALKSSSYISALQSATDGIRDGKNISYDQFGSIGLPLPPVPEQTAIANFLDRKTARIDALVAEQQRLITLLKEKRQAVISHAVTKGLNPDAPMKDSEVEWLGEVPAHWHVDRFKASIKSARNGIWGEEPKGDETDISCVRVADFDRQQLCTNATIPTIRSVTVKEREGRTLMSGNLLLEKSGGGENQPVGCVVLYNLDEAAVCSNFVARVELKTGMCPSYWRYVHAAAYSVRLTTGSINQTSGIQNLDQSRYFNERAPFPPEAEQSYIASFLDGETAKLDALVSEAQSTIAILNERRAALISAAVTGQIDVRGLVAREAA